MIEIQTIHQPSEMRDGDLWLVRVGGPAAGYEWFSLSAHSSDGAAFTVAAHVGFSCETDDDWAAMMRFRAKRFSTVLSLPDGRGVVSEPLAWSLEQGVGTGIVDEEAPVA
jgi:hypothetical protein